MVVYIRKHFSCCQVVIAAKKTYIGSPYVANEPIPVIPEDTVQSGYQNDWLLPGMAVVIIS